MNDLTIHLPEIIDVFWLNYKIQEIEDVHKETPFEKLILDWNLNKELLTNAHCAILHLKELIVRYDLNIEHCNIVDNRFFELFQIILTCNASEQLVTLDNGIYLSPVINEDQAFNDKVSITNFVRQIGGLSTSKDTDVLEMLIYELYMNICQHADTEKGFIYVTLSSSKEHVLLFFSDMGIGLVSRFYSFYKEEDNKFIDDSSVLAYALESETTTNTTARNRGQGLYNCYVYMPFLSGEFLIFSGKGTLFTDGGEINIEDKTNSYKGTFVQIEIPLNSFIDKEDFNNNIDVDF